MGWGFLDFLVFAGGYATCWFTKDAATKVVVGTEAFAASLQAKATALKAAVTTKAPTPPTTKP